MKQQRNTKQRQMVLDAVRARCDHPSADQIYHDVRFSDGRISRLKKQVIPLKDTERCSKDYAKIADRRGFRPKK